MDKKKVLEVLQKLYNSCGQKMDLWKWHESTKSNGSFLVEYKHPINGDIIQLSGMAERVTCCFLINVSPVWGRSLHNRQIKSVEQLKSFI